MSEPEVSRGHRIHHLSAEEAAPVSHAEAPYELIASPDIRVFRAGAGAGAAEQLLSEQESRSQLSSEKEEELWTSCIAAMTC